MADHTETAFSMSERQKNIERGQVWIEKYGTEPYAGEFKEIDLSLEWYCPQCASLERPLKLNTQLKALYCTENYHLCEYSYLNAAEREERRSFLGIGYSWPLTRLEVLRSMLKANDKDIFRSIKHIEEIKRHVAKGKQKTIELQAEIDALEGDHHGSDQR